MIAVRVVRNSEILIDRTPAGPTNIRSVFDLLKRCLRNVVWLFFLLLARPAAVPRLASLLVDHGIWSLDSDSLNRCISRCIFFPGYSTSSIFWGSQTSYSCSLCCSLVFWMMDWVRICLGLGTRLSFQSLGGQQVFFRCSISYWDRPRICSMDYSAILYYNLNYGKQSINNRVLGIEFFCSCTTTPFQLCLPACRASRGLPIQTHWLFKDQPCRYELTLSTGRS